MAKIGEALSSFINTIPGYKSTFKNPEMEQGSIAELMAGDEQKAKETSKPGLFQRIQEKVSAFFSSNVGEKRPMPSNEGEFDSLEETTKAADRTAAIARAIQGLSTFEKRTKKAADRTAAIARATQELSTFEENTQGMERGSIAELMASGAFDDEE